MRLGGVLTERLLERTRFSPQIVLLGVFQVLGGGLGSLFQEKGLTIHRLSICLFEVCFGSVSSHEFCFIQISL